MFPRCRILMWRDAGSAPTSDVSAQVSGGSRLTSGLRPPPRCAAGVSWRVATGGLFLESGPSKTNPERFGNRFRTLTEGFGPKRMPGKAEHTDLVFAQTVNRRKGSRLKESRRLAGARGVLSRALKCQAPGPGLVLRIYRRGGDGEGRGRTTLSTKDPCGGGRGTAEKTSELITYNLSEGPPRIPDKGKRSWCSAQGPSAKEEEHHVVCISSRQVCKT